jgi:hypothetical protein
MQSWFPHSMVRSFEVYLMDLWNHYICIICFRQFFRTNSLPSSEYFDYWVQNNWKFLGRSCLFFPEILSHFHVWCGCQTSLLITEAEVWCNSGHVSWGFFCRHKHFADDFVRWHRDSNKYQSFLQYWYIFFSILECFSVHDCLTNKFYTIISRVTEAHKGGGHFL